MKNLEHRGARRAWSIAVGCAVCIAAPQAARAQAQDQQITPSFRENDIRVVIEGVQAVTGRPMIVDPRVRANVTLYNSTPLTPDEFYQLFLQMLEVHGYMAIESDGVTQILPDANARQVGGSGREGRGSEIVTQTIELRNVGAAQLVPILRPMMPQYAHLAAHQSANMLILSDRAGNMQRMVDIIRRIDRVGSEDVEVIPLQHAAASEVVRMMSTLVQASAAATGVPTVQAFPDERTNSVLLSGSANMKAGYRELIASLDTPSETGGETLVRYLNYADAEDLAAKLQAQYGAQAAAEGAAAGPNTGAISIWPDSGTNALVINAPARIRQDMLSVIDRIDIRRLQVLVDAIIVEVSEDKAAELGLTWVIDGSDEDEAVGLTNFPGASGGGILNLASIGQSATPNPAGFPQGITMAVGRIRDAGTSWAAVVSALRGDAATNIISTPTITVLDNEEAEIRVGQEVPFVSGQFTSTGSSDGSVNPFTTIQRQEVGTRLKITPQINEGTGVQLAIEQETSSLSSEATGAVDLVTNTRSIVTSVYVDDGDVLILGGLIDDQLLQREQRVPVLGRIPGLGWLFRARKTDRERSNLMVFIRPTILRDSAGASEATSGKYQYLRDQQEEQSQRPPQLMRGESHPELPPLPAADTPATSPEETPASGDGEP
jgi:general secretion pathway protein D